MRRVGRVAPVHAAESRPCRSAARPLLHRRGSATARSRCAGRRLVEEERVAAASAPGAVREVERVEVVVRRLDLAAVDDLVAEAEEDVLDLAADLRDQVQVPAARRLARKRDVDSRPRRRLAVARAERASRSQRLLDRSRAALSAIPVSRSRTRAQGLLELALAAEVADARLLELRGRRGRLDRGAAPRVRCASPVHGGDCTIGCVVQSHPPPGRRRWRRPGREGERTARSRVAPVPDRGWRNSDDLGDEPASAAEHRNARAAVRRHRAALRPVEPQRHRGHRVLRRRSRRTRAAPVVELGVGTGRIAVPTALAGIQVIGVDSLRRDARTSVASAAELAGVAGLLDLRVGDLRDPPVDGARPRSSRVPFRALLHLATDEDRLQRPARGAPAARARRPARLRRLRARATTTSRRPTGAGSSASPASSSAPTGTCGRAHAHAVACAAATARRRWRSPGSRRRSGAPCSSRRASRSRRSTAGSTAGPGRAARTASGWPSGLT